ncbi:MAG: Xaa-Pro peptidase family protein [Thermodesulfobacteriota bacterium]
MDSIPEEELSSRTHRLQKVMMGKGLDAVFIIQKADLFYFAGTCQSSVLCIPAEGSPLLIVRKSYERACKESALENIVYLPSFGELPLFLRNHKITNLDHIGMEFDVIPTSLFFTYQRMFPKASFGDISMDIRNIRMAKSGYEIDMMRNAGKISDAILKEAKNELKVGRTEVEIASCISDIAFRLGSQGFTASRGWNQALSPLPFVLSGGNGAMASSNDAPFGGKGVNSLIPVGPSNKKIEAHEPIVIDIGATYNGYSVDTTRTFSVGNVSSHLSNAYEAILKIQEQLIKQLVTGKTCSELYQIAEEMAKSLGYGDNFMGYGKDRVRFVGHGIGIEVDELPIFAKGFDMPLGEGMTVAIEPKIIFPGIGAVCIENTWLINKDNPEPLTVMDEALCII